MSIPGRIVRGMHRNSIFATSIYLLRHHCGEPGTPLTTHFNPLCHGLARRFSAVRPNRIRKQLTAKLKDRRLPIWEQFGVPDTPVILKNCRLDTQPPRYNSYYFSIQL